MFSLLLQWRLVKPKVASTKDVSIYLGNSVHWHREGIHLLSDELCVHIHCLISCSRCEISSRSGAQFWWVHWDSKGLDSNPFTVCGSNFSTSNLSWRSWFNSQVLVHLENECIIDSYSPVLLRYTSLDIISLCLSASSSGNLLKSASYLGNSYGLSVPSGETCLISNRLSKKNATFCTVPKHVMNMWVAAGMHNCLVKAVSPTMHVSKLMGHGF